MFINFHLIIKSLSFVLTGIPYTLGISVLSFLTGCLLGIFYFFLEDVSEFCLGPGADIYFYHAWCSHACRFICPLFWSALFLRCSCLPCFVPILVLAQSVQPTYLKYFELLSQQ